VGKGAHPGSGSNNLNKESHMKQEQNITECPDFRVMAHGHFEISTRMPGQDWSPWEVEPNLVVTEGMNYILAAALGAATQKATFHIALFGGNVTPLATWTGANWVGLATEFTNYTEPNRVVWNEDAAAGGGIGNTTNPALFTIGGGGGTVRGAALVEASAKSAVTGIAVAAARFASDKIMSAGEELRIRYSINLSTP
jgi:hypothetical protein